MRAVGQIQSERLQGHKMAGRVLRTAFCQAKRHIYLTAAMGTSFA